MSINLNDIIAIDVHTHAEVSCCQPHDDYRPEFDVAFASIDPHKGRMGAREAKRLIEDFGVKRFKFHPTVQGFYPNDRMAFHLYEVIAEAGLPMLFHSFI